MAFQSHSIPWHVLSSIFQYQPARTKSGPQHADLFPQGQLSQPQQLEYFALRFQSTLHEHASIEMRRYRDAKSYAERAKGWTSTQGEEETDGTASVLLAGLELDPSGNENTNQATTPRNRQRRRSRDNLQRDEWPPKPESRRIYPDDFPSKWTRYLYRNLDQAFTSIEMWIEHVEFKSGWQQMDDAQRMQCWTQERDCAAVLTLLIADAACTPDKEQQRFKVETMFLLAHHPRVGLDSFLSPYLWCCNVSCGVSSLVNNTLNAFLYLNLICAKYKEGEKAIFAFKDCDRRHAQSKYYRYPFNDVIELDPHSEYMNFKSWMDLLAEITNPHKYQAQTAIFQYFLLPKESDEQSAKGLENDPLADIPALKEFLKSMWKVLVICDMIYKDIGKTINWEWCVLDSLHELFRANYRVGLMGRSWIDYELARSGYPEDQNRSGFCFYEEKAMTLSPDEHHL